MKKALFKKGFKAVKEEEKRREDAKKDRENKLWRVFFPKDADEDFELNVRFLTDEPVCFHEHTFNIAGKITNKVCIGEGCPHCATGNKPRFVGAFLIIDRTEYMVDERDASGQKTGKKKKVKDKARLLVRGQIDLAKLDRLNAKYGLLDRDWSVMKTGSDTSTSWNFDRGEVEELSDKEIRAMLPENIRTMDFDEIVMEQISPSEDNDKTIANDAEVADKVKSGVQNIEEEEENKDDGAQHKPNRSSSNKTKIRTRRK